MGKTFPERPGDSSCLQGSIWQRGWNRNKSDTFPPPVPCKNQRPPGPADSEIRRSPRRPGSESGYPLPLPGPGCVVCAVSAGADFLFIHFSCRSPKVYGRRRDDSGLAGRPEKSTVGASEDFYERRKDHAARAVHTLAPPILLIIGKSLFPARDA